MITKKKKKEKEETKKKKKKETKTKTKTKTKAKTKQNKKQEWFSLISFPDMTSNVTNWTIFWQFCSWVIDWQLTKYICKIGLVRKSMFEFITTKLP